MLLYVRKMFRHGRRPTWKAFASHVDILVAVSRVDVAARRVPLVLHIASDNRPLAIARIIGFLICVTFNIDFESFCAVLHKRFSSIIRVQGNFCSIRSTCSVARMF
jgi:hypothetical protein